MNRYLDARTYAMGNTASVLPGFCNPASSAFLSTKYLSLQYTNKYGLKELSSFAGIVNYPNSYLNTSFYLSRYGFDIYNETLISLNVYKQLSKRLALGLRTNYINIHYSDKEPNTGILTADIGMLISLSNSVNISFMITNPLRTQIKMGDEKHSLPNNLVMGVSYQLDKTFLLTSEIEKDYELPALYKVGFEYSPIDQLSIRGGMWTKPFTPSFGVGLKLKPFIVDLAFSRHPVLGFHSNCGLLFNF